MKFRINSYLYSVKILFFLIILMGYAPHIKAEEEHLPQKSQDFLKNQQISYQAELLLPINNNLVEIVNSTADVANISHYDDWPDPVHDNQIYWLLLIEQLEYRHNQDIDSLNWEVLSWIGGDYQRIWLKTEGEIPLIADGHGEAELQILYGQLVGDFWDFLAGLRYDHSYGSGENRGRVFGVIGIQGLAPYMFEIDASLFISQDGDISARFSTEYELLLTQKLILQPEFKVNIALQEVQDFGVGSGLNDIELGLRMRYEINRQVAPYVGVSWERKFGDTADFAKEDGEGVDNLSVVGGMRLLF